MRSLPTRLWSGLMVTNDTFSTVDDGMFCVELILPFISTIAVTENLRETLDKKRSFWSGNVSMRVIIWDKITSNYSKA